MEFTSFRRVYRAWNISFQRHDFLLVIRVCGRDCGEQRFCVRMHRMIEHSFGRRKLLMIGAAGMAVCQFIVGGVGTNLADQRSANIVLVVFVCLFIFFFAASWGPVAWVVTSEIYPLKIRAKSMSISTASNCEGQNTESLLGYVFP